MLKDSVPVQHPKDNIDSPMSGQRQVTRLNPTIVLQVEFLLFDSLQLTFLEIRSFRIVFTRSDPLSSRTEDLLFLAREEFERSSDVEDLSARRRVSRVIRHAREAEQREIPTERRMLPRIDKTKSPFDRSSLVES